MASLPFGATLLRTHAAEPDSSIMPILVGVPEQLVGVFHSLPPD